MITAVVEWAKRPKAIPEFWTWWMLNGPIDATASPIGSRIETIDFVSWSATIAVPAIDEQGDPLREAGADPALRARDRLQGVRRGADADVDPPRRIGADGLAQPCSCRRLSSRQSVA